MAAKLLGYKSLRTRNLAIARYLVDTDSTTRQTAEHFGVSKTTVCNACHDVLRTRSSAYMVLRRKIVETFDRHTEESRFPLNLLIKIKQRGLKITEKARRTILGKH